MSGGELRTLFYWNGRILMQLLSLNPLPMIGYFVKRNLQRPYWIAPSSLFKRCCSFWLICMDGPDLIMAILSTYIYRR